MTKRQIREQIIFSIYYYYIMKLDNINFHQMFLDNSNFIINEKDIKEYEPIIEKISEYENIVSKYLTSDWKFYRLSNLEKAIMILSTYEILYLKIDFKIVINEAVEITKKYCNIQNYAYINKVLEQIRIMEK